MTKSITIAVKVHRIRWDAEDADGSECGLCGCKTYGKQFRAMVLMQIGRLPIEEELSITSSANPVKTDMKTLLSLLALCFLTGCTTVKGPEVKALIADRAAYRITERVLLKHPDWRSGFERARFELGVLQASPRIDALAVIDILDRLPPDALGTDDAWIITDAGTLIIIIAGDPALTPKAEAEVRATLNGLISGMDRYFKGH